MKKIITILLTLGLSLSLIACGSRVENNESTTEASSQASSQDSSQEPSQASSETGSASDSDKTISQILCDDFQNRLNENPSLSTAELAESLAENSVLTIDPMAVSVSPGLLMGFDNAEINNFTEGYMLAPMIGSIPFLAYVFETSSEEEAVALEASLKENANLRWVVCTEADEMSSAVYGNKVFFVMSPKSFEDDGAIDEGL